MRREGPARERTLRTETLDADLVVVGGGMAGTCCAITAARMGARVVLLHDRPVLGGNASSEVRLWVLGATAHMGSNNRWAREGGLIDEILVENLWRNPEGNPVIFDTILLEMAVAEPTLVLRLNTAVYGLHKAGPDRIDTVEAFCSQNSTRYHVRAPLFCDASGDGIVGYLSGAAFRVGAERPDEFGEPLAPDPDTYGELLGHTIYFYSRDTGQPVVFVPPAFALKEITRIPRYHAIRADQYGARLWWFEYGGRHDTVHDTEQIKWELWKVAYGAWNYIKNSGRFPEAATMTLEWVGAIPGKRESRRFEGPYMLTQRDLIEQRPFVDAVSFGGWAIDLHPADGVYSALPSCTQWYARGIYSIPYRCLYSRNVRNLFLAGRSISVSHVAHGSTRVMATCANSAQAVGVAAVLCAREGLLPADLSSPERTAGLQRELLRRGQFIPGVRLEDPEDLAPRAALSASSVFRLTELPNGGPVVPLDVPRAQMLPLPAGPVPRMSVRLNVAEATTVRMELRTSDRPENHTPDRLLEALEVAVPVGVDQMCEFVFSAVLKDPRYVFLCLLPNPALAVHTSLLRVTGLLSAVWVRDQTHPPELGVESFPIWCPQRRPGGQNLALSVYAPVELFGPENVINGIARPTCSPNAWVAAPDDPLPRLVFTWGETQTIRRVELAFDTDFDHPMESVLLGHPERAVPFCVKHYRLRDGVGTLLHECVDNHQTRNTIQLDPPATTDRLVLELVASHGPSPAALFAFHCYSV